MKVTPEMIDSVMSLAAKHTIKAPELLDLLNVMVTAGDELSLPVKRNQVYIMKSFMQHRAEVALIIDQPKDNRFVNNYANVLNCQCVCQYKFFMVVCASSHVLGKK